MICPRCQNQLPDGSVACNKCGLSFQYQQPVLMYKPLAKPKKKKKTVIIVLSSVFGTVLLIFIIAMLCLYRPQKIDYGDAAAFEKALNDGENVVGKVVRFKVDDFKATHAGYNLWAGEHLNFLSYRKTIYSKGDIATVKVTKIENNNGKWGIWYKIVRNGKETDKTICSD